MTNYERKNRIFDILDSEQQQKRIERLMPASKKAFEELKKAPGKRNAYYDDIKVGIISRKDKDIYYVAGRGIYGDMIDLLAQIDFHGNLSMALDYIEEELELKNGRLMPVTDEHILLNRQIAKLLCIHLKLTEMEGLAKVYCTEFENITEELEIFIGGLKDFEL